MTWKVEHPLVFVDSEYQLDDLLDTIMARDLNIVLIPKQWRKTGKAITFDITRWTKTRSWTLNT